MTDALRLILELGKTRKVVAGAMDWPIQFLVRRTAHHVMDHAWEMEDRDVSRQGSGLDMHVVGSRHVD